MQDPLDLHLPHAPGRIVREVTIAPSVPAAEHTAHETWTTPLPRTALALLAALTFALHLLAAGHYGTFRDERYYLAWLGAGLFVGLLLTPHRAHLRTPGPWLSAPYVMPYEDHLPIHVCRGLRVSFAELWPEVKNFS